jgi:hypothetical protein
VLAVIREEKTQAGRRTRIWDHDIKMSLEEIGLESVVNDLAQNRDKWRTLMSALKTFRFRISCGEIVITLLAEELVPYQEWLFFVQLIP